MDDAGTGVPKQAPARLLHPLCGSNLSTLIRALVRSGGTVRPARVPHVMIALAAVLCRWPFSAAERAWMAARRRRQPAMPAPLFIVGHLRSGTTHLQNVLSRSGHFGQISPVALGLPWDMLGLGALLSPLLERVLPDDRYVDQVRVTPDAPQEDEIALANMQTLSYYHALYFPRRFPQDLIRGLLLENCTSHELATWRRHFVYFLEKVSIQQQGRRLLIKNPVYTARIALINEIWPDAQFIHVHRDPRRVFASTVHYFHTLLEQLALQRYDHIDIEQTVLKIYPRIMAALLEQSAGLPPDRFVEVGFECFEREPVTELRRIYERLGLPGFEVARPNFELYLQSVRRYSQNRYDLSPETVELVERAWAPFVARWGPCAAAPVES